MVSHTFPSIRSLLLIAGILLIAANLRAPVTAVAPLLTDIQAHFRLSTASAGLLTTLPLLVFAATSSFSAQLSGRLGLERTLFCGLCLIAAGVIARSAGGVEWLFAGTIVSAIGIALGNVLLPGLVKREFPGHLAMLTSIYALIMGAVAALSSGIAVPLAQHSHWRVALASTALVAVISLLVWLPQLRGRPGQALPGARAGVGRIAIWRYALAWQVTLFFGLNSFAYYVMISWLPAILHDNGYSAAEAGRLHGLMQLASALAGLLVIALVRYGRDQRGAALLTVALASAGLLGLLLSPQWATLWTLLFGLGNGAVFILAISFVGLRANSPSQAAALSAMAQGLGYLLAALGPTLTGYLHDLAGSWLPILVTCLTIYLGIGAAGILAGRSRTIG